MRRFQHPQDTGHADGTAPDPRIPSVNRLSVRPQKQVFAHSGRGGFPPVVTDQGFRGRVPVQQKPAAADPGTLRFDEVQYHLDGDCRVHSAAALPKNVISRPGRQRVCRRNHEGFCGNRLLAGKAACGFRFCVLGRHKGGKPHEKAADNQGVATNAGRHIVVLNITNTILVFN